MKNVKIGVAGLALVLAFVAASAFKAHRVFDSNWTFNGGSPTDPNSYTLGQPQSCPTVVTQVCYITAPEDVSAPGDDKRPLISQALMTEINNDLSASPKHGSANVVLKH